jgi:prepilin-type N-terminal cleavage/methylation domain-containing protein
MFKLTKNRNGFTLIEVVVAIGILAMLGGFVIASLSAIPKAKMKETTQIVKSEFELTRNFAKTHGGDAMFSISKTDDGINVCRTSTSVLYEESRIKDPNLCVFYKLTGDDNEYNLGVSDADGVENATIEMTFSQTEGAIIGPHMLDYILLTNGTKEYKLIIQQKTGMIYYDYELDENNAVGNQIVSEIISVAPPYFIVKGAFYETINMDFIGTSLQPELKYDARYVRIGGVYRAIERGSYVIVFTLKDPYSTAWADGFAEDSRTLIWKIK